VTIFHRPCGVFEKPTTPIGDALNTPRLRPITISLSEQQQTLPLTNLVSAIKSQLGFRPRNAAERATVKSAPCSLFPFCAGEHQHSVWTDVHDLRDGLMAGIDPPPTPVEVADIAAKRAVIVALNARLSAGASGEEDLVALTHTFEVLKGEFRREERARDEMRSKSQELISARIKALLAGDVAAGRLVISSKNELDYVKLDHLIQWATYRDIVVEQEVTPSVVFTSRAGAEVEGVQHHEPPYVYIPGVNGALVSPVQPWLVSDPRDDVPEGFQPWYIPARYFARDHVRADSTLLTKRDLLAKKVAMSLHAAGFYKRGKAKESLDPATVKKAFVNVKLG
jgi:hypothetical protein